MNRRTFATRLIAAIGLAPVLPKAFEETVNIQVVPDFGAPSRDAYTKQEVDLIAEALSWPMWLEPVHGKPTERPEMAPAQCWDQDGECFWRWDGRVWARLV